MSCRSRLGNQAPDPQTIAIAASLLVLGATFFIADGVQVVAASAPRGPNEHARAALVCRGELLADRHRG